MTCPTPATAPLWICWCACPNDDGTGWTDWFPYWAADQKLVRQMARNGRWGFPGHLFAVRPESAGQPLSPRGVL